MLFSVVGEPDASDAYYSGAFPSADLLPPPKLLYFSTNMARMDILDWISHHGSIYKLHLNGMFYKETTPFLENLNATLDLRLTFWDPKYFWPMNLHLKVKLGHFLFIELDILRIAFIDVVKGLTLKKNKSLRKIRFERMWYSNQPLLLSRTYRGIKNLMARSELADLELVTLRLFDRFTGKLFCQENYMDPDFADVVESRHLTILWNLVTSILGNKLLYSRTPGSITLYLLDKARGSEPEADSLFAKLFSTVDDKDYSD
jgi:hypothetical protein